jgi:hypothetical protein
VVQRGDGLATPLAAMAVTFVLLQVLPPIHTAVGLNLGDRTAAWLYDRLTEACVRPPGVAHLEDPELTSDLTAARDFDTGMMGPPLSISMDFIAGGMAEMIGGVASAVILFGFAWWAPSCAGARLATHWLLRERDLAGPRPKSAQRGATPTGADSPSIRPPARAAALRTRWLDARALRRATDDAARTPVQRTPAAAGHLSLSSSSSRTWSCSGAGVRRVQRASLRAPAPTRSVPQPPPLPRRIQLGT